MLVVVGIWVYALLMIIPTSIGKYGTFDYDPVSGKCDYLANAYGDPRYFLCIVGFGLPFILIAASYADIWRRATKSSKGVKPYL